MKGAFTLSLVGWGGGEWGLGVRVRMKGAFTTNNPLFHSKISWLRVTLKFSLLSCAFRLAPADAHEGTENLGATPNHTPKYG